jgi:purine-nucleoside phosphorylase
MHLRAEAGDYAEACLLPGDPGRARRIAEKHLDGAVERNSHRGLLGYTGEFRGTQVSVQATGMGGPSAAIVVEELVQLGVRRFLRVGTCGSLQRGIALGELILAVSAVPADGTSREYAGGEPHAPTADWELVHGAVHAAKHLGLRVHAGPVATCDVFYEPDTGRFERWQQRGILAVEMEAATLFTLAALRGVEACCLLVASNGIFDDTWLDDQELQTAVDRMTEVALATLAA